MYLISPNKKQYKANLHSHTTISDGKYTPEKLKEIYRDRGYSILSITDHEIPRAHNELTEQDFLLLTGYEAYIRPSEVCKYDVYAPEVHLNLFAKDPGNEKSICFNRAYCKRSTDEEVRQMQKAGSEETRRYTREYINMFIQTAIDNGYLVAYNHPYWSMEKEEDILAYEGYFSMEMCNYGSYRVNHLDYNGGIYDKMLSMGKRVFCHSGDDNHNSYPEDDPMCDSFGAFTMIMADELKYDKVIEAMESGEMYSSMGPVFKEVSLEGDMLHVECSEVAGIYVYYGSKAPSAVRARKGEYLTQADIKIDIRAPYIRVSILDKEGNAADTRGFFRDELGLDAI